MLKVEDIIVSTVILSSSEMSDIKDTIFLKLSRIQTLRRSGNAITNCLKETEAISRAELPDSFTISEI